MRRGAGERRGHLVTTCGSADFGVRRGAATPSGSGSRKTVRTSGGAAMKQHDHRLHDEHDVDRDALRGLHRVAARLERTEQDAGEEDAPRPGAAEQGDRDRVEADAGVDPGGEAGGRGAEHLGGAGEADEAAGDAASRRRRRA